MRASSIWVHEQNFQTKVVNELNVNNWTFQALLIYIDILLAKTTAFLII